VRRLRLALLLVLAALVLISAGSLLVSREINDNAQDVYLEDAIPLRASVSDLVLGMVNQQTAMRGYVIARDPALLRPYFEGRRQVADSLAYIGANTGGHPVLDGLLARARPQIARLDAFYASQIELVRAGRLEEARSRVNAARFEGVPAHRRPDARRDRRVRPRRPGRSEPADRPPLLVLVVVGGAAVALAATLAVVAPRRAARLLTQLEDEREATDRARDRTDRLQQLTAGLASAATTEEVADAVLGHGREATGVAAGSIALLSIDGREFVTHGLVGYPPEVRESFPSYPADAPLPIPDAVRDGPLWLQDADAVGERYPHLAALHAELGHEAVASLPLRVEGRTLGGRVRQGPAGRRPDGARAPHRAGRGRRPPHAGGGPGPAQRCDAPAGPARSLPHGDVRPADGGRGRRRGRGRARGPPVRTARPPQRRGRAPRLAARPAARRGRVAAAAGRPRGARAR
jgi:CHASE3 domain/GAF domain